jgi:hypothetical protein
MHLVLRSQDIGGAKGMVRNVAYFAFAPPQRQTSRRRGMFRLSIIRLRSLAVAWFPGGGGTLRGGGRPSGRVDEAEADGSIDPFDSEGIASHSQKNQGESRTTSLLGNRLQPVPLS